MKILQGISVSSGIGSGAAFVIADSADKTIPRIEIAKDETESGWLRLQAALKSVCQYLESERDLSNSEQSAIFETYALILSDSEFQAQVKKVYEASGLNIEYVLHSQVSEFAERLGLSGDAYLKERAEDITDLYDRVLNMLLKRKNLVIDEIPEGAVIVASSLRPSDAVIITKRRPVAIVLEEGGLSSHLAILARSYAIPSIFGVSDLLSHITTDMPVIIDAGSAVVIIEPDKATLKEYAAKSVRGKVRNGQLAKFRSKPALTKDGVAVTLLANIGTPEEAQIALNEGAQGIGLFRTEFLFMNSGRFLSEDEQFEAYKHVLQVMKNKSVTIRTLDSGGDKVIEAECAESEKNPLLGWRALRFCLDRRDIFKTQLRSLFRASVYGQLKIMFPLVTDFAQLVAANALVAEVKEELRSAHIPFYDEVPIGIMIETASAAVIADLLTPQSAFFSIGTNDLTQYVLCVDRENTRVSALYDEFHPAVLRLIKQTVTAAQTAGIPVSVCGEAASSAEGVLMFLGLGIRALSMSANRLSPVKELLASHTLEDMTRIASHALNLSAGANIRQFIQNAAGKNIYD